MNFGWCTRPCISAFHMSAAFMVLACSDGRRTVTGAAAQYALTIRVQPGPSLTAVSQALAWPSAAVPGARVIVDRILTDPLDAPAADTAVTDAQGLVRFTTLALARYTIRVARTFSADERARAATALGDVEELAGVSTVAIVPPAGDTARVQLTGVGGSSLVISEVFPAWPATPSGQQYYYGGYFEIHNNSDTTVPLAKKILLNVHEGYLQSPQRPNGCTIFASIERDPTGVWGTWMYRFPDDARALAPGGHAVVATDAVDHRRFGGPGFFDLSRADYEFRGTADVDNPIVPNMIEVGPRIFVADGHGYRFRGGRQVWALANALDVDTLPRWTDAVFGGVYTRVPAAALLDLVRYDWDVPRSIPSITFCPSAIAGNIDAADAVLLTVQDTLGIHRKVSRTLPSGRVVYQRSRNSASDWIAGPGTPGKVP